MEIIKDLFNKDKKKRNRLIKLIKIELKNNPISPKDFLHIDDYLNELKEIERKIRNNNRIN